MNPGLGFGLSIVLSFITWGLVARNYLWPVCRHSPVERGFALSCFFIPSALSDLGFWSQASCPPDLPTAFAAPAAYGDLVAALLALLTLGVLERASVLSYSRASIYGVPVIFSLRTTRDESGWEWSQVTWASCISSLR